VTLRLVPDYEEELVELTKSIEVFHDIYAPDLPYAVVAALQEVIGYEGLERCTSCHMRKYLVVDHECPQCRADRVRN
jgi:DNA-binding helix-hairpin-helix protein with protein kinase domain